MSSNFLFCIITRQIEKYHIKRREILVRICIFRVKAGTPLPFDLKRNSSFSKKILPKIELTKKEMDKQLNVLGVSFKQHKKYFLKKTCL